MLVKILAPFMGEAGDAQVRAPAIVLPLRALT